MAMVLAVSAVSAVNWAEVVQKARAHEVDVDGLGEDLASLGLEIVPFGTDEAETAAGLWVRGARSLALADRACLATAIVRRQPVLTADRAWTLVDTGTKVRVIR